MTADGVVIAKVNEVNTSEGIRTPAFDAGIYSGDIIKSINEIEVTTNEELEEILQTIKDNPCVINIIRDETQISLNITPVFSVEGNYKIGLTVRDSMAGIGTITFIEPKTGLYGSLGHGITDIDSGVVIPIKEGSIMPAEISSVIKGSKGNPGALDGDCKTNIDIGSVETNDDTGIFGIMSDDMYFQDKETMQIANPLDVQLGKATILSNVSGEDVLEYDVEIIEIITDNNKDNRNLMIKVCDEKLLESTGGIVQGMSGSPILQNGKLIGAVTHVLVNDPTRGYGIFIENMIESAESINN